MTFSPSHALSLVKNKNNVKGKAYARVEWFLVERKEKFCSAQGVVVIWLSPGRCSGGGDVRGENNALRKGKGDEGRRRG